MQLLQAFKNNPFTELKAQIKFIDYAVKDAINNIELDYQDTDYYTHFWFDTIEIQAKGYNTGHFCVRCKTNSKIYYSNLFSPNPNEDFDTVWFISEVGMWIARVCEKDTSCRVIFDAVNNECAHTKSFDLDKVMLNSYKERCIDICIN